MRDTTLSRVQTDIVAKIIDYVRREKLPADSRLTESQLAEEFGVSRSPIRAALQLLADKGIVISAANKGHYLARDSSTLDAIDLTISPPSDASLYDRIAMDRMRDGVAEQFTEASFMRRYDVSRAQLVRTLTNMSHDGLVRRSTGHGWIFMPSLNSAAAYAASYRFRIIIEPAGLMEPTFLLDRPAMARCREAHEQMLVRAKKGKLNGREIFDTNAEFHEMLAVMSGNRFIAQAIEQQNKLRRLSEYYVYDDESRIQTLVREHCEIMDGLVAGDQVWAATLLRRHLEIASRLAPPFAELSSERVPKA
ncbi:GntR family transcriptional regulator [Bradyrhizobium canariense]|uniref:DNA-binding transcriptional regulator, GntR family n=1 Tax=Bradyrhizobium canariense TaxID=255045 RepID=A0A1H1PHB9_9BRAD|nr:GntR family transcriptional regulator [Bradyrhizobium canariense]SDS10701.1 DNA-binding transcriptional regulator, GntR family [Bradyrhizobium canariense]